MAQVTSLNLLSLEREEKSVLATVSRRNGVTSGCANRESDLSQTRAKSMSKERKRQKDDLDGKEEGDRCASQGAP